MDGESSQRGKRSLTPGERAFRDIHDELTRAMRVRNGFDAGVSSIHEESQFTFRMPLAHDRDPEQCEGRRGVSMCQAKGPRFGSEPSCAVETCAERSWLDQSWS